jgi:hypothetical protein
MLISGRIACRENRSVCAACGRCASLVLSLPRKRSFSSIDTLVSFATMDDNAWFPYLAPPELANNPDLKEYVRFFITLNGYECPEIKNLWSGGMKPMGISIEVLCGSNNNDEIYPALHYEVFPDHQMKVTVCKPSFRRNGCD